MTESNGVRTNTDGDWIGSWMDISVADLVPMQGGLELRDDWMEVGALTFDR